MGWVRLPALYFVDLCSNLIPLAAASRRLKGLERSGFVIVAFLGGALLTEFVTFMMAIHGIHNLWLLNLYNAFEFSLPMLFFFSVERSTWWKKSYFWIWILFMAVWVASKFTIEPLSAPTEYTHTLSSGILSVYAVHILVGMMKEEHPLARLDYKFWSAVAILFYFTGSIVFFGAMNAFIHLTVTDATAVIRYHWIIDIVTNVLFTLGFIWRSRI